MNTRVKALQNKVKELDLDAYLVASPYNRRYISGFTGTAANLLITKTEAYLITDFRYIEQAKLQAPNFKIVKVEQNNYYLTIRKIMETMQLDLLGFEGNHLTFEEYEKMTKIFGKKSVLPYNNVIEEIRVIKSDEEIEKITKACQIADEAFSHVLGYIKPGVKEKDIALELEFAMRRKGASANSFDTIIASGVRSSLPHGVASDKAIEHGDFVTMDFGCIYEGYCSDMTRTIVVGEADEKQKQIYDLVLTAQLRALDAIKAGQICQDIDKISRDYLKEAGYGQYFGHGLGHSLGLEIHEEPRFSPVDQTVLVENMVLSVEPGLYLPQWGGVRIEDLVVVKDGGYTNLTTSPKNLIIVE